MPCVNGEKPSAADGAFLRCIIVSGHRRRAALELLVKEGKDKFASVPCIREANAGSAALQELRLIYANSDTRRMTSAEISKQAERVEALLYQLKEEGMDFPGRMRDHVAEACKVSKSKLARLKVIRDNLDKGLKKHYEKGDLSESAAYALAHQPVKIQRAVFDYKCTGKNDTKYLRDWEVDSFAKVYTAITEQKCKKCESGKCEHGAALLGKIYDDSYGYKPCEYAKCCKYNQKTSVRKFELMLAANFRPGDVVGTVTYDDSSLPQDRKTAERRFRYFRQKLAAHYKARGVEMVVFWSTEHKHGDSRWHHHFIIPSTGDDYDAIRAAWIYGNDIELKPLRVDKDKNYANCCAVWRAWRCYRGRDIWNYSIQAPAC